MLGGIARYRVEVGARADARFDALVNVAAEEDRVMGAKSLAYLDWRLRHVQDHRVPLLLPGRAAAQDLLAAYLVYSIDGDKAFVADLFAPRLDETVDLLLLHFAMWMRSERRSLVYLSYFGDPAFGARLERLQFFRRPPHRQVVLYTAPGLDPETAAALREPRNWLMLDGELDV